MRRLSFAPSFLLFQSVSPLPYFGNPKVIKDASISEQKTITNRFLVNKLVVSYVLSNCPNLWKGGWRGVRYYLWSIIFFFVISLFCSIASNLPYCADIFLLLIFRLFWISIIDLGSQVYHPTSFNLLKSCSTSSIQIVDLWSLVGSIMVLNLEPTNRPHMEVVIPWIWKLKYHRFSWVWQFEPYKFVHCLFLLVSTSFENIMKLRNTTLSLMKQFLTLMLNFSCLRLLELELASHDL